MTDQKEILNYAGNDFSTLLQLNMQVPAMNQVGVKPVLGFTDVPESKNSNAHSEKMRDFSFFDRRLLQEVVIPFMDAHDTILNKEGAPKKGVCYTPSQLCELYNAEVMHIKDVNSVEHASYVRESNNLLFGLSSRCLQRFEQPIIDTWGALNNLPNNEQGFLVNVHPGRLPDDRGVLPIFRAASRGDNLEHTIHAIVNRDIDIGDVYGNVPQTYKKDKSVLWHYAAATEVVNNMVMKFTKDVLEEGKPRERVEQDPRKGSYYSYPSEVEIEAFEDNGGIWTGRHETLKKFMVTAFTNGSFHDLRDGLNDVIDTAIASEFGSKSTTINSDSFFNATKPKTFVAKVSHDNKPQRVSSAVEQRKVFG